MMALAWQTNQTRVATFKLANEATMRAYTMVNVTEAFHPLSHHGENRRMPSRSCCASSPTTPTRMTKFVQRLKGMKEGSGSVLDNSVILFGSNMANTDRHNNDPLPQAIIGHGGGIKGGQHLHYPQDTPHANLLLTLLQKAGAPVQSFPSSTGVLAEV